MRPGYKQVVFWSPFCQKFLDQLFTKTKPKYMASSRSLLRAGVFSRFCGRTFASEVAVSQIPRLEYYTPLDLERADTASELADKAKQPWTGLSKEDKIAIYRANFAYTMEEIATEEPDGKKVIGGVSILMALSFIVFVFLKKYVSAESPRSINEEWANATIEKLKKQRANPITGVSSQ